MTQPTSGTPSLAALIRASAACLPGGGPGALKLRAAFVLNGRRIPAAAALFRPPPGSALDAALRERPELRGILVWPYQCAAWDAARRVDRLCAHYRQIDALDPAWRFAIDDKRQLADLGERFDGLTLVLDQPRWFMREGGLTLNLFVGRFRAFSIAFSLFADGDGRRGCYIGGIQGRNREDMLELYRGLTRALHGLRPRDFLIEMLRLLCRHWQVGTIHGVADAYRHHRHPYFGGQAKGFSMDYDAIWEDRGGEPDGPTRYRLPVTAPRRDLEALSAKKRAMYRKRYALLDALESDAAAGYPAARLLRFEAT